MTTLHKQRTPTEPSSRRPTAELVKLRRGEITLEEYLDVRVEESVAHLKKLLSPSRLDIVRDTLREELRSDPVLVELVRQATGLEPRRS